MTADFPSPPGPDEPLWRHMHYAACTCADAPSASACIADELLVLAEWLVPLEREPSKDSVSDCPLWARWDERRRLRKQLMLEARRANNHPITPEFEDS
ncbi:MAG: hypothetical protein FJ076_14695 [Cyanobacteria bacterium K_DeepCast_35m_m1_288]|nr:hypothetical protein [Cyanobacteria bacterium K_DeepCast_35m_m1_288]